MKRSDIITDIPKEVLDTYSKVLLDIDIMFVNGCAYFIAILQHIGLIHCCLIASRLKKQVVNVLERIITEYKNFDFTIDSAHGNN